MRSISAKELLRSLDDDPSPFLLDVRDPEEVADGVIDGSVNIPMQDVADRLGELPTNRDIVVICHLGVRSAHVAKQLNALGYDRALNLDGGMEAWANETREE